MSCQSCQSSTPKTSCSSCYEARLWLGLDNDNRSIIGTLDGIPIQPIPLKPAFQTLESTTSLKYDPDVRSLVFENERSIKGIGSPDYVSSREILGGAILPEIGGVGQMVESGLASVWRTDDDLELQFVVPTPLESGESGAGFLTYVASPNTPGHNYKLIQPDTGGQDSIFIGRSDGSTKFEAPISTPLTVAATALVNGTGIFNGAPSVNGTTDTNYRYQTMGTSQVVTNTSGSKVEVELAFRISLSAAAGHTGVYARLINGGSDYKTTFAEGGSNIKTELSLGGQVKYTVALSPNQRAQFEFGIWANQPGNITAVIGSLTESGNQVSLPVINIRRII